MELQLQKKASQTLKVQGQILLLEELKTQSLKLNLFEKKIINSRISGVAISESDNPQELKILCDVAIFKIAAISGFTLPSNNEYLDILNEEFLLMLNDFGYSNLTFDEIINAFRFNAVGWYRHHSSGHQMARIESYSTFFNMQFAGKILETYMSYRSSLDSRILHGGEINISDLLKKYDNYQK